MLQNITTKDNTIFLNIFSGWEGGELRDAKQNELYDAKQNKLHDSFTGILTRTACYPRENTCRTACIFHFYVISLLEKSAGIIIV